MSSFPLLSGTIAGWGISNTTTTLPFVIDFPARGVALMVDVQAVSGGTDNVISIKLQDSPDGSAWADALTISIVLPAAPGIRTERTSDPLGRYVRLRVDVPSSCSITMTAWLEVAPA